MPDISNILNYDVIHKKFSGLGSPLVNTLFGMVDQGINMTIVIAKEQMEEINSVTRQYSGCFGMLQRGEADIATYPTIMPVINIPNITQVNYSGVEAGVWMMSPYCEMNSVKTNMANVLSGFLNISFQVYLLIVLLSLLFLFLMITIKHFENIQRVNRKMKKIKRICKTKNDNYSISQLNEDLLKYKKDYQIDEIFHQVMSHLLKMTVHHCRGVNERFISFMMSSFAFLFFALFLACYSTESVSIQEVKVYDTYEKILSNKSIQPVWAENLNDHDWYRLADNGSRQKSIWNHAIEVHKSDRERPELIPADSNYILEIFPKRISALDFVFFLTNLFPHYFLYGICAMKQDIHPCLRFYGKPDKHLSNGIYVVPISRFSKASPVVEWISHIAITYGWLNDPTLMLELDKNINDAKRIRYDKDFFKCLRSNVIYQPEPAIENLSIVNFKYLFYLYFSLNTIASLVFIVNLLTNRKVTKVHPF